jgi:hypothetical protein
MARATTLEKPLTMMVDGHAVIGFDDKGRLSTFQFLPDNENVDLLPKCTIQKCSAFIRRDGTLDLVISKIRQQKD